MKITQDFQRSYFINLKNRVIKQHLAPFLLSTLEVMLIKHEEKFFIQFSNTEKRVGGENETQTSFKTKRDASKYNVYGGFHLTRRDASKKIKSSTIQ